MNIEKILARASELRIAVVGDLIIDKYIIGTSTRISPEAPVLVLNQTETRENFGGAGNVVENLRGLGVQVSPFYGKHVPVKTRVMAGSHHIIRIDEEEEPYWMKWDEIDIGLGYGIHNKKFDCVVISDYSKGCISEEVANKVINLCIDAQIPVVVDAKRDFDKFMYATILKCNTHDWRLEKKKLLESMMTNEDAVGFLALEHFIITNGEHGMSLYYEGGGEGIGGYPVSNCDPCGAGDTVTAIFAIISCMKSSEYKALRHRNIFHACTLANIAASEVCKHAGVFPINKQDLIKRFNEVYNGK
jgi:rfaE bifunctional protein kinase chain/domain